jgi:hypothetical protein
MKSPDADIPPAAASADDRDEATGLPGLASWRGVYLFVIGSFILWVLLLLALTMSYS